MVGFVHSFHVDFNLKSQQGALADNSLGLFRRKGRFVKNKPHPASGGRDWGALLHIGCEWATGLDKPNAKVQLIVRSSQFYRLRSSACRKARWAIFSPLCTSKSR
jgi:hypothetical protein